MEGVDIKGSYLYKPRLLPAMQSRKHRGSVMAAIPKTSNIVKREWRKKDTVQDSE